MTFKPGAQASGLFLREAAERGAPFSGVKKRRKQRMALRKVRQNLSGNQRFWIQALRGTTAGMTTCFFDSLREHAAPPWQQPLYLVQCQT
jgi:hypothetical protein